MIELTKLFPAAFQVSLAFNAEMCRPAGERHVQCLRTMRLYPLEGFAFETEQDERNALWLLNWMHWAHRGCRMDTAFRPPLVVIDGPPMCGKSMLLNRLAEIAEVPLTHSFELDVPKNGLRLDKPVFVFDGTERGEVEREQFELLGFLMAETWEGRLLRQRERSTKCLRSVTVMVGNELVLPPELHRRAMFIRLGERHAEA